MTTDTIAPLRSFVTAMTALVDQVLARDSFARLAQVEARLLRAPVAEHRKTLAELGIPLTQDSYISATPRR